MVKSKTEHVNVDKTVRFGKTAAKENRLNEKSLPVPHKQESVTSVEREIN